MSYLVVYNVGLRIWLSLFSYSSIFVYSETVKDTGTAQGFVFVDGISAIGEIDDDFICATLDWWPPEKCDYGTCSWDHASLLMLVLSIFLHLQLFCVSCLCQCVCVCAFFNVTCKFTTLVCWSCWWIYPPEPMPSFITRGWWLVWAVYFSFNFISG